MIMIKKILYAGAASVALFAVAPASAATISSQASFFDGTTGTFSATVAGAGAFSQAYTFDVGAIAGDALLTIISGKLQASNTITGLTLTLNSVAYPITTTGPGMLGGYVIGGSAAQMVSPGLQSLVISGNTTANSTSFSGTIDFSVAAVPEPASWALMIGGFGLVGGAMRRRAKATRVTYAYA
ncbi:MAG TPA: FxDxF family PEP-CTERM protein [Sphingomonas sp.]|jgi:hypothetical protein|uniref:FxDxF family PEP-CTERM protein n=1 Tax=Sphingomonas sp. TaxID=28214 RepID=UPI002EDA0D6B